MTQHKRVTPYTQCKHPPSAIHGYVDFRGKIFNRCSICKEYVALPVKEKDDTN